MYVDNLLVVGTKERIMCEKKEVAGIFEMCDLGEVHWFLAMEITCDWISQMITIDQWQYIRKILEHFGLKNAQSVSTPMAANIKLPKLEVPEVAQHLYQSMLGSLMYAAIRTRPDIMFTVHHLSQFLATPGSEHLVAMKCVYQYLSGTQNLGITYHGNQIGDELIGFTDLDWAGDSNSRRSVSRYTFIFCGAVVTWLAKKQLTIALLSTKPEYMPVTHTGKEPVFLEHLYDAASIPLPVQIF